jgi:hypothetical protein
VVGGLVEKLEAPDNLFISIDDGLGCTGVTTG